MSEKSLEAATVKTVEDVRPTAEVNPLVKVVWQGNPAIGSKLVWWLAMLAGKATSYRRPVVGDWVVECTHTAGTARHGIGMLPAVGKVLEITGEPGVLGPSCVKIMTIEGVVQNWSNAQFYCLEDVPYDRTKKVESFNDEANRLNAIIIEQHAEICRMKTLVSPAVCETKRYYLCSDETFQRLKAETQALFERYPEDDGVMVFDPDERIARQAQRIKELEEKLAEALSELEERE